MIRPLSRTLRPDGGIGINGPVRVLGTALRYLFVCKYPLQSKLWRL